MDLKSYVFDFWGSIFKRKLNMLAVTIFVATYFGLLPTVESFFWVVIFLLAYSSIYYYNDLLDYEEDRQRKFMPSEKLLYHGVAGTRDYIHLLAWFSTGGVALTFLKSTLFGVVTAVAILLNHFRTVLRGLFLREVLLGVVELLNFEALWIALYGTLIPGFALPVFVTYSAAYALSHAFYKLRSRPLQRAFHQWWLWVLAFAVLFGAVFSIPLAASSVLHLVSLLFVSVFYALMVGVQAARYKDSLEDGMHKIFRYHDLALVLTSALLIVSAALLVYANLPMVPVPLNTPKQLSLLLSEVDHYQNELIRFVL